MAGGTAAPAAGRAGDMATGLLVRALAGVAGVWVLSRLDNSIPQPGPEDVQARRDRPRGMDPDDRSGAQAVGNRGVAPPPRSDDGAARAVR